VAFTCLEKVLMQARSPPDDLPAQQPPLERVRPPVLARLAPRPPLDIHRCRSLRLRILLPTSTNQTHLRLTIRQHLVHLRPPRNLACRAYVRAAIVRVALPRQHQAHLPRAARSASRWARSGSDTPARSIAGARAARTTSSQVPNTRTARQRATKTRTSSIPRRPCSTPRRGRNRRRRCGRGLQRVRREPEQAPALRRAVRVLRQPYRVPVRGGFASQGRGSRSARSAGGASARRSSAVAEPARQVHVPPMRRSILAAASRTASSTRPSAPCARSRRCKTRPRTLATIQTWCYRWVVQSAALVPPARRRFSRNARRAVATWRIPQPTSSLSASASACARPRAAGFPMKEHDASRGTESALVAAPDSALWAPASGLCVLREGPATGALSRASSRAGAGGGRWASWRARTWAVGAQPRTRTRPRAELASCARASHRAHSGAQAR
jgi:hypothetical protein